jgi:hypothetical protein
MPALLVMLEQQEILALQATLAQQGMLARQVMRALLAT